MKRVMQLPELLMRKRRRDRLLVLLGCLLAGCCVALLAAGMWLTLRAASGRTVFPPDAKPAVQTADFRFSAVQQAEAKPASLIRFEDRYALGVRYPAFGEEKMDRMMREDALRIVEEVERAEQPSGGYAVVTLDYELVEAGDRYLTVVYHLFWDDPGGQPEQRRIRTFLYDRTHGQRIEPEQLFAPGYAEFVSGYVREWAAQQDALRETAGTEPFLEATQPELAAFGRFSCGEEGLTLYFDAGELADASQGVLEVPVPAGRVSRYLKRDLWGLGGSSQPGRLPENVDPDKPMIALTFDDGPYVPVGNRILDALEQVGGRATFFYLGERVNTGTGPLIQRAAGLGCEIGSHSFDHPNLTKLDAAGIWDQFSRTDQKLEEYAGVTADVMRPPYGAVNDTVKETVTKPIVTWSVDTLDWKSRDADQVVQEILDHVKDGDIILMHELYPSTAEACERVIPQLAEEYQLVTVRELMLARGVEMQNGKIYYRAGRK